MITLHAPSLPQLTWLFLLFAMLMTSVNKCNSQQRPPLISPLPPASLGTGRSLPLNEPPRPIEGISIPLTDEELDQLEKEKTRNVVRLAATDQLNSEIITNRTRAYLSCELGEMIVKINFSMPFRGVAYSDYDRSSPCKFFGDGSKYYEMRLPLKGCGTRQEAPRLFINNIIVRFHRSLELEEDEIKTIICRYPPPEAPPPPSVVAPILEPVAPVPIIVPAKLSEIELLLIICALLFLTLLLLGIGVSYYCLKRRNIKIIRKKKPPSPAPSEVTKISSVFDQIRIPRAVAMTSSADSSTEYPSSDSEERRTIVSETSTFRNDHFKYENTAFIPEPYPVDGEKEDSIITSVPLTVAHKPILTSGNFTETLISNQLLTNEDVINETHKKVTSCLYKKLPTTPHPPSIPDNDCWSQAETVDNLPLVPYVPHISLPRINVKNVTDTYLTNESETLETELTSKHNNIIKSTPAPKITSHDYTETLVQNENIINEETIDETHHKVTTCLYKKLPTVNAMKPPSIPDNDCWSQAETDVDEIQTRHFPMKLPTVTLVSKDDVYLTNQSETIQVEDDTTTVSTSRLNRQPPYIETNVTSLDMSTHEVYHQSSVSSDRRNLTQHSTNYMYQRERDDTEVDAMTTRQYKSRVSPRDGPSSGVPVSQDVSSNTRLARQPTYIIDTTANYDVTSQGDTTSSYHHTSATRVEGASTSGYHHQQQQSSSAYYASSSSSNYPHTPASNLRYITSPPDDAMLFDTPLEQPSSSDYYIQYDNRSDEPRVIHTGDARRAAAAAAASSYHSQQQNTEYTVIEKIGGRPSSGQSLAYYLDFDSGVRSDQRDNDIDELTTRSWKLQSPQSSPRRKHTRSSSSSRSSNLQQQQQQQLHSFDVAYQRSTSGHNVNNNNNSTSRTMSSHTAYAQRQSSSSSSRYRHDN